jgi:hypothetical protein
MLLRVTRLLVGRRASGFVQVAKGLTTGGLADVGYGHRPLKPLFNRC